MTLKNDFRNIKSNLRAVYDQLEKRPELEAYVKKDINAMNNISCSVLKTLKNHLDDDIKNIQPGLFEEESQ